MIPEVLTLIVGRSFSNLNKGQAYALLQFAIFLLLSLPMFAQRVSVQWTLVHPQDFQSVKDWATLPSKPYMSHQIVDDAPGWVAAIKVDDTIIFGCDHYALVMDKAQTHITSYCWNDGRGPSFGIGAQVCTHEPMKCTYYGNLTPLGGTTEKRRAFRQFVPPSPALVRHGKFVPNQLWNQHKQFWKGIPLTWILSPGPQE
jgi:hypothetical protein